MYFTIDQSITIDGFHCLSSYVTENVVRVVTKTVSSGTENSLLRGTSSFSTCTPDGHLQRVLDKMLY